MTTRERTGADVLVEALIEAGVEHVFGLPGDTGVDLYDSFARHASILRHIMCRDERHAAIMADVYARRTNRIGVVEVSSGGGATYCVGGLGEAYAASTPLLVISSDIHDQSRGTGALTELNQERLFAGVTKWVGRAHKADQIPFLLGEAIGQATSGRPSPVALILPENVLLEKTVAEPMRISAAIPQIRVAPSAELVDRVAAELVAAERPVIVAGGGVHLSGAYSQLARLAEAAATPVATTIHGKGSYSESSDWSLGVVGANGGRPYVNEYLEKADFALFVGTRANATDTNSFRCPPRSVRSAQIDIDPGRAGRNYPGSIGVSADAGAALAAVAHAVADSEPPSRDDLRDELARLRQRWMAQEVPPTEDGMVHPLELFRTLERVFGDNVPIVADCGTATPYLAAHWPLATTGRKMIIARGHGPMGYAIPGVIAAAVVSEGERVVGITTDGSLAMACGEFETAARLNLPITYVQLTNGSFGWIKMLQHLYHESRYFGVDLGAVDAPLVARGFGLNAVRVTSQQDLESALQDSVEHDGPSFIEVLVPELFELTAPVAPWIGALSGTDTERPVY